MPTVTDIAVPYEILIRFDETGALRGAHKVERRIISIDGETVRNDIGPAEPLTLADGEGPDGLWGALGQALTSALATLAARDEKIAALEAEAERLPGWSANSAR